MTLISMEAGPISEEMKGANGGEVLEPAKAKSFSVGERVEAIWSQDGEKYPGTIVSVSSNGGTYEVLFDDGVRTRRKANLIFKAGEVKDDAITQDASPDTPPDLEATPPVLSTVASKGRQRAVGKNVQRQPPALVPMGQATTVSSDNSKPSAIPRPPPLLMSAVRGKPNKLLSGTTTPKTNSVQVNSKKAPGGPPILTPRPSLPNDNNDNSVSTNGNSSPKPNNGSESDSDKMGDNNSSNPSTPSTKKERGFVYVQQPHYSVFDLPPRDLGKRQRRVHNYSMLARGPSLKKGTPGSNGVDEIIDGETTPNSSRPSSRSNSPSLSITVASNSVVNDSSATPTPNQGQTTSSSGRSSGGFIRKRRFLKSPPKPASSTPITTTTTPPALPPSVSNSKSSRAKGPVRESVPVEPVASNKDIKIKREEVEKPSETLSSTNDIKAPEENQETAAVAPSEPPPPPPPPSKPKSSHKKKLNYETILVPVNPEPEPEEVPTKRLRKPSVRFSAEEGYVDIFSTTQRRRTLTRSDSKSSPVTSSPAPITPSESLPLKSSLKRQKRPPTLTEQGTPLEKATDCDLQSKASKPEDEELLDVGQFTVVSPTYRADAATPSSSAKARTKSPVKKPLPALSAMYPNKLPQTSTTMVEASTPEASDATSLVHQRPLRQTSRGRIVRPPVSKTETVHDASSPFGKLVIPKVQVLIQKCDSVIPSRSNSTHSTSKPIALRALGEKAAKPSVEDDEAYIPEDDEMEDAPVTEFSYSSKNWKKKKWNNKGRGLYKSGVESHAMQLLKRSRLQRRFENRPKQTLLQGITKKRLKKIVESIKRRKLKRKRLVVSTKFKDVRVDIINCVCGRTDEFGLMVQCEVCFCWQHGNCFGFYENDALPRFYVCQSCASPKRVRPTHRTEGIRQEMYKKGVLPSFPFAPRPSIRQQRILKRCSDLTRMIESVENAIRQTRLKEMIATSEPEHKKLYQWSAPRAHPKDLIQKWRFNKYYKTVVRRLLLKNKGKLEYPDKLASVVAFREKLKKYSQAFDEAKLAISRKIGSRGLILVEKLSEQEVQLGKISKVKDQLDSELAAMPEQLRNTLLSRTLQRYAWEAGVPLEHSVPSLSNSDSDTPDRLASKKAIDEFISQFSRLVESEDSEDDHTDSSNFEEDVTGQTTETAKPEDRCDNEVQIVTDFDSGEVKVKIEKDIDTTKPAHRPSLISPTENRALAEEILRFNLEQLDDYNPNVPIIDDDDEAWVQVNKMDKSTGNASSSATSDMIKVTLPKKKRQPAVKPPVIDVESESEATLSGDTTVSVEDSEGGEEYWYNPISDLNAEHDSMRKLLLRDDLAEYDRKADGPWEMKDSRALRRDWLDDVDFYLNADLGLALDSISDSDTDAYDSSSESGESLEEEEVCVFGEEDVQAQPSSSSDESDDADKGEQENKPLLRYWQKAILELEQSNTQETSDDEDEDWVLKDEFRFDSDSEDETEISTGSSSSKGEVLACPGSSGGDQYSNTMGVLLVTADPSVSPGEVVDVRLEVDSQPIIRRGMILSGTKGQQHIVRLLDSSSPIPPSTYNTHGEQQLLCKTCQDSLGSKWTWKQLSASKGVNIALEDTLKILSHEVEKCKRLGASTLESKTAFIINPRTLETCDNNKLVSPEIPIPRKVQVQVQTHEPRKLTELCRDALSKPKATKKISNIANQSSSATKPNSNQPASAEEESILSLLSLSKTPVECNGENVSELSIESLRKLTDRLQQNGPLSEDLAKAVTGYPLTNGKIGIQNLEKYDSTLPTSIPKEPFCVRCKLQDDNSRKLTVLISSTPVFLESDISQGVLQEWCRRMSKAVEDVKLSTHLLRYIIFQKVKVVAQRKKAERIARELNVDISEESVKKRIRIAKPDSYLSTLKSEFVDALMPYATHFISRFTKRDQVRTAKKKWISEMVQNYNNCKRALKGMLSIEADEQRIPQEDVFYASLDNLRKSFDIVLTKKDIKMRRQNQSLSLDTTSSVQNEDKVENIEPSAMGVPGPSSSNTAVDDNIKKEPEGTAPPSLSDGAQPNLVNGPIKEDSSQPEPMDTSEEPGQGKNDSDKVEEEVEIDKVVGKPTSIKVKIEKECQDQAPSSDQSEQNSDGPTIQSAEQLQEDILARLATYPLQAEDVSALLGALDSAPADETRHNDLDSVPVSQSKQLSTQEGSATVNQEQPLELDDFRLIEENLKSAGENLVLGPGDMDLINTIGSLGAGGGGDLKSEDSDLLLNVFDPIFADAPEPDPVPCSSRSITRNTQSLPPPVAPSLAKLTPEMCKGFLLDDIRAHQQVIDQQLDKIEAEIIELERKRGNGVKEKDSGKLFEVLYANMQILLENSDVLKQLLQTTVGTDGGEMVIDASRYEHIIVKNSKEIRPDHSAKSILAVEEEEEDSDSDSDMDMDDTYF